MLYRSCRRLPEHAASDAVIDGLLMLGQAPLIAGKLRTIETLLSVHQPALKEACELVEECLRIVENRL